MLAMKQVFSSNIQEIGYDADEQTLAVKFNTGALYHYFGVPGEVARSVMNAPSVGTALTAEVKDIYQYQRQPKE